MIISSENIAEATQGFHGNANLELIFQIKDMDNSNDTPIQIYLNNF